MKKIILTDLDHTVSDSFWRDPMIGTVKWDEYHRASADDLPIEDVCQLLRTLDAADWLIVGVTARPAKWRKLSMDWMIRHAVPMHELLMRTDEDYRPAPPMKIALARERFGPDFAHAITFMLEDRSDVAAAFKAEGVTVLQVHASQRIFVHG
jgi:hypothetical protein